MSEIDPSYWDAPPEPYEGAFFDAFEAAVIRAAAAQAKKEEEEKDES